MPVPRYRSKAKGLNRQRGRYRSETRLPYRPGGREGERRTDVPEHQALSPQQPFEALHLIGPTSQMRKLSPEKINMNGLRAPC